jgi:hypothetical protein
MIWISDDQIADIAACYEPNDLPGDLPEIAEFIGVKSALLLARHMGVGRIYLKRWSDDPNKWSKDIRMMVDIIGEDDAKIIVSNFCLTRGSHIDIPKCDRFWRQSRNKIICSSGNSRQVDLGRKHNLSDRQIRSIQKRAAITNQQPDLFAANSITCEEWISKE